SPTPSPSQSLQVQTVDVKCAMPWTQRCSPPFPMKIFTNGPTFSYKFTTVGCSDIQLQLYVDDQRRDVTGYLGLQIFSTGWRLPIEVSPGSHDLKFWAVGKTG